MTIIKKMLSTGMLPESLGERQRFLRFAELLEHFSNAAELRAVLTILEQRFSQPDFSAQKLAAATGLSERYVNELLYDAGASFTARLNELRLGKAARLLAMTANRISDIASESGFNDLSYFNRSFRRRFGLTPTAARAK